jgi:hypothetical protein
MTATSMSRRQAILRTTAAISSVGAFSGLRVRTAHAVAPRPPTKHRAFIGSTTGSSKQQSSPTDLCDSVIPPQASLEHQGKKSRRC